MGALAGQNREVNTEAVQTFAALLTVVTWVATVVTFGAWALRSRWSVALDVHEALRGAVLWLTWVVTLAATVGSLYMSEVANYVPCNLCWYQRIAMYPLVVILLIAGVRKDVGVRWYVVPVAGIGLAFAIYHYFIEWFPSIETDICSLTTPCSTVWFREFGFISLPLMGASAFTYVIVALVTASPRTSTSTVRTN